MFKLLFSVAGAAMLAAPSLAAPTTGAATDAKARFSPSSFDKLATVFNAADLDHNNALSQSEYTMLRTHMIAGGEIRGYRGDRPPMADAAMKPSFAKLDSDSNSTVSASEFMNGMKGPRTQTAAMGSAGNQAAATTVWLPDYMTVTYYLMTNPIDASEFRGRDVVNLDGEFVGEIERIVKTEDEDRYYAMVDLRGRSLDPTPAAYNEKTVGIPLDDVVMFKDRHAVMLTTRGEEFLRDANTRKIEEVDLVEKLYTF